MLPTLVGLTVLALHIHFRSQGVRWPLRDGDEVEVWDDRARAHYFTVPAALLKTLLRHHLDGLAIHALMREQMTHPAVPAPMPETTPIPRSDREARRHARRRRRPT